MSRPRLIAVIAAVVAALGLAGGVGVLWLIERAMRSGDARIAANMPAGWGPILRVRTTVPDAVRALALARDDSGNGADALYDTTRGSWQRLRLDSAFARLSEGRADAGDSLAWPEVEADTVLDRWVRYARRGRWESLPLMLVRSDSGAEHDLMALHLPDYRRVIMATQTLALRGWRRSARGNRAGARTDLAAAMGLGEMLARHEPTLDGLLAGRRVIHTSAIALLHLATVTRDSSLARLAQKAADWSAASTAGDYSILAAVPDSALAFAADSALAAGWRAAALTGAMSGALRRPSGILFGVPQRHEQAFADLAATTDRAFRPVAVVAEATARWLDNAGPLERLLRFAGPGGAP